jgi:DNA-binding response OmpR family regulator
MAVEKGAANIFIAEDSLSDFLLIQQAVKDHHGAPVQFHRYENGETALGALGEFNEANLPDLIIIDLNLPRIGGMQVLKQVRSSPLFNAIPVLILTSSRSEDDRAEAAKLGANAYVSKAPTLDEFLSSVGAALRALLPGSARGAGSVARIKTTAPLPCSQGWSRAQRRPEHRSGSASPAKYVKVPRWRRRTAVRPATPDKTFPEKWLSRTQ